MKTEFQTILEALLKEAKQISTVCQKDAKKAVKLNEVPFFKNICIKEAKSSKKIEAALATALREYKKFSKI